MALGHSLSSVGSRSQSASFRSMQQQCSPGSHARELNPYFKNGGTGLPEEESQQNASVGLDGAWLRRALQRAKEQAEKENKSLEEVAAQRWGSLAKFHELLAEAEGRGRSHQGDPWQQGRWNRDRSLSRERRRDRLDDRHSDRRRSRSREKSRRDQRSRSRERQRRSRSRERRNSRSRSRDRQRRSRSREHDRKKEKSRHRIYSSSSSSTDSESDSRSRSGSRNREVMRRPKDSKEEREGGIRNIKGLLKPPCDDSVHDKQSSSLASRFQKPGEGNSFRSMGTASSSSSRGWQKKQKPQEQRERERTASRKPVSSSSSSSSSSDSEEEPPQKVENIQEKERVVETVTEGPAPQARLLTDKEMNELAAKIMKAELIGNEAQAVKLKKKLEVARAVRANAPPGSREDNEAQTKEEVVVLTRMDSRGVCRPVSGSVEESDGKRKKKMKTHGKDGQRTKYFPDDDQYDLKRMFEKEKGTSAADQNSLFERSAMQNTEKLNEEYDLDDMFMSKAVQKESSAKQAERDRQKAIDEHKRSERSLESCQWCFDNKEMPKHLIVALGKKAYICLPPHQSLTPGHCLIVPIHHIACSVQADEDLWSEIQDLRKSLVRMFNSRDEDCVFFETVKRLRNYPHMVINCVPLPKEMGDMAPIYFKKAIMECEAEWAQNKKLVDLKNRSVRSAVPKGLPYFFVDFAMDPGYAHVIEDEQDFPHNFAQEIVGGMLDLETNLWRKPRKENFDQQRRKVMEFNSWYKEFDPTQDK
ncbi:CWF19-like protein 2 [Penaeus vannamei]|uniref:CWF19-like protein 2 n=1 Tax=Penaeus vannamei TaxID=6689 RepID=UPI00387FA080